MKVLVYTCPEAPERVRFMAVQLDAGAILPVRHLGSDPAVVAEASQAFWDSEQQKLVDKGLKRQKAKAAAPAPAPPAAADDYDYAV